MATLAQQIAVAIQARHNCVAHANEEWLTRWTERLDDIARNVLPSGSGFDCGTKIDMDASNGQRLLFSTEFHHMNDHGMYTRWTDHTVIVTPSFNGFDLRVTGVNHRDIKDYIGETFHACLSQSYEWPED